MQPYKDDPEDDEARESRRLSRLHQMEQLEAAATGRKPRQARTSRSPVRRTTTSPKRAGNSPRRTTTGTSPVRTTSSPVRAQSPARAPGLSHRTFVARQFLEDDDEDIGGNAPIGSSSSNSALAVSIDEETGRGGRQVNLHTSQPTVAAASGSLFSQANRYEVDQTVNLMDVDAAQYQKKDRKASMVDIFLDSTGAHEGHGFGNQKRLGKCQEICCAGNKKFLWMVALTILGVSIVVASVTSVSSSNSSPVAQSQSVASPGFGDKPKKVAPWKVDYSLPRIEQLKQVILERRVTTENRLMTNGTAANKAWLWISDQDEAQLGADHPGVLERYALAAYFYSTQPSDQGDLQEFDGWYSVNQWMSKQSVCRWYGVDCEVVDETGYKGVVHLNHTHNQLQGTLPKEMSALSYLALLDVSNNRLTGPISAVSHIRGLKYLIMNDNLFTGNIDSVGSNPGAIEIRLSNNKLTGSLPEGITALSDLATLMLDHNMLNGKLQHMWTDSNINALHINHNEFEGNLPYAFFRMSTLVDFRAGNNLLTGTIAPEIESIRNLEIFEVHENNLHGTLPEAFDRLTNLRELRLQSNQFTGDLPKTFGKLSKLEELLMDNNQFTGAVPSEVGGMSNLKTFVLHHNKLSKALPTQIGGMKELRAIWLNHNELTGSIPMQLGNIVSLEHVYLQSNDFMGTLPNSLGNLKQMETLRVFNNTGLGGTMPPGVCSLKTSGVLNDVAADCKSKLTCACCSECY